MTRKPRAPLDADGIPICYPRDLIDDNTPWDSDLIPVRINQGTFWTVHVDCSNKTDDEIEHIFENMTQWCEENCSYFYNLYILGQNYDDEEISIIGRFTYFDDSVMFKLAWV